ncbi:dynein axonemal heavy chain 6 [Diabrotica virgifera virgifera]|uniref:AAA+ ATPase domain-containing protein n=2 Tax=Diabrotica virgifera virgifera TaxID=50390 RepID=A0ABM5LA66_DIAVI|nr:dynein axonemal heavy chain 6 [Diabrotica virgifera virgifera]
MFLSKIVLQFEDQTVKKTNQKLADVMNQNEWIDKFRHTKDGSFVYLTYAVPSSHELFYPYALRVVPYKLVDKSNFFTMSAKGVMQHVNSETIFTSLDKWENEYKMYCRLMEIKLFLYFRKWKGFYFWRTKIKRKKIYNAKRMLKDNLLSLNPILRQGLLAVQDMCYKMIDVSFTDVSQIENTWLFYFVEDQMEKFHQIMIKIEEYHTVAKEVISSACHGALLARGFVVDERIIAEESQKERKRKVHKASYIEQAAKKKFCERLSSFIILTDYITINMLHQLITNSLNALLKVLDAHTQFLPTEEQLDNFEPMALTLPRTDDTPKLPWFVIYVKVLPDELLLDPSLDITLDMFNQMITLWEEKTKGIKSFVGDSYYYPFTNPIINEKVEDRICGWGPTLEFYLSKDVHLAKKKSDLIDYFRKNYDTAFSYLRRYQGIREFYADDILVKDKDIENERDLETFRMLCTRYHDQITTIESILPAQEMGVLYIQLEGFVETCLPESQKLLGTLELTIPWVGKTKVDALIEESAEIEAFLFKEPTATADYVKYLEYIEQSNVRADEMENIYDYCKELYDIIDEFNINVDNEEVNTYLGLSVTLGNLRNLVDKKMEDTTRLIKLFSDALNKDISALISQVGTIKDECMQPWLYDINSNFAQVMEFLTELFDKLVDCQKRAAEFKEYQKQFRLEVTRFDVLDEVMNDVKLRILLWDSVDSWAKTVDEWYHIPFDTLDVDEMNMFIAKNLKYIAQLEKGLPVNLIVPKFRDEVELMKDKLPVVCYLRNPALKNRHWILVENLLNHKFKPDETMTLELLETLGVFNNPAELMEISGQASSEAGLEALLKKVEEAWKTLELPIISHKDAKDLFILGSLEDVQAVLDESNINMTTIASSRHVGPIKPRVDEWTKNLDLFSRTLDEWTSCQQQWLYLEVIFSAPDIQRQLPNEAKLFTVVDKSWKEIMRRTAKMPLAMESALYPNTLEAFLRNNALLEQIMRCLESYLETKRVAFPRFYFLSNDELLDILAQTRNPHAVQPHLRKCFDAIARLEFGVKVPDEPEEVDPKAKDEAPVEVVLTTDIIAMISPEGERVALGKGLKARGNVEDWLGKVEESMVLSLKRLMKASLVHYQTHLRTEWALCHANQIILTVSQIMWAKGVHDILDAPSNVNKVKKMEQYEQKCISDLNDLAKLIRKDLASVPRKVLVALITIDVHARDTVSNIVASKITNSSSFDWLKVLRYYWHESIDDCQTRMSSASYLYGYEYLGAAGVLVITPLTDKCYLCLMGALQLDLGGAPAGPAGTGKTETTKDLAKALAIQCVVFNCSEGLDYKMMGRFFSGLAQSGAWCCFDEFNRIDIEVLSVIAQQLITIRNAKAAKVPRFMFEGREIKLVQKCAAFITMNPGYAGRTELPDNLKALFRPIAMMVPDYALIAEVILYSEGFESSKNLSHKMVQMYKLCSEQLSQQDHYDFGMRAVKSVLVMAGSLKRAAPDREEDVVLICALRDSNLPKFLADDAILFTGILGDLFPGIDLPVPDYGIFQSTIEEVMVEHNLQPEECMIHKIIQLYETMIVRWGVMLVGPTGGGKSEILKTLNRTLTRMHHNGIKGPQFRPVRTYTMNPKAITAGELYGEINPFTLEWKDGLMGITMRTAVGFTTEEHQWIICDGPVDAVWIENLNTVLDDNKMLCLANSERIKLTEWVHMVFEVQDLSQASPATVSRCGMVYVDSEEIKWFPYVKSWMANFSEALLSQEMKEFMLELFDHAVENGFMYVKKHSHYSIHQVDVSKAKMVCSLIESFLKMPGAMDKIGEKSKVRTFLCQTFILCYLWGVGGNLLDESREKFEIKVRDQFDEHPDSKIQASADLWDLYMDVVSHRLELWAKIIPVFKYMPELSYFETLVPTIDTVRFGYIMERLIYVDSPVFITGETGVGKSVVAKDCLHRLFLTQKFVPATINFSAQTSSARTQEIIELKLEKKKRTLIGAPVGKKVVIFVDDVNMPKLDTYGAQPPIELLRQLLDYGGLYDREKLFWKDIRDVVITVACAPPGGGRNPLTPRFVRHFGMLLIPPPSEVALKVIFKSILRGFLNPFTNEIRDLTEYMVNAAVDIYQRIESDLLPTPAKSHYVFNLRDLSKCIQGITQADPGSMRTEVDMLRLFYHECLRVFHDRLINVEDKSYFYLLMKDICVRNFGSPVLDLPEGEIIQNPPILLFGDFIQMGAEKKNRVYEELKNIDKLKNVLQDYLDDFNLTTAKEMKLIFFMMAVEHCIRIARVLRSERGNSLLVGVGGMGKQSLTKLAAHLNVYKCFQIELTRNYDHMSFFEDLRKMCFHAGVEFEDSVFLFTDTQIVKEEFLEDINNLLNSGEVPNLYEAEEYEHVIIGVRGAAKVAGIDEANRDGIYDHFISRVRIKLHLVICMSPVGDAFRRRCRMFPSLVNCCTIDWFEKWPQEALLSVAESEMISLGEDISTRLARVCVAMHESVEVMTVRFYEEMKRYYYTTPSSYLELIKLYRSMLGMKKDQITKTRDRINNGLKKLYETNSVIDSMKETLTALEPVLAQKSIAAEELMVFLSKEQKQADTVRTIVKADEEVAKVKAEETQAIADDAQKDLDTALPALEAATKALESLNKNDINEVKVFQKPPKLVQVVMESVCLLLGAKTDWASAKIVLSDAHFLKKLQEYDKDHVSDLVLRKLKVYIENPDFVPDKVVKVSKACKSLCLWVRAMDMYAKVYRVVEPKRKKLQTAEKELAQVMALLRDKQMKLAEVEAQIANLEANFNATMAEKKAIEDNIELTAARLNRAGRLNVALGDEQSRWEESVERFGIELENAVGDVLMAAACVAYLGAFTSNYRMELVNIWERKCHGEQIPAAQNFSLITVLADPYEIRTWNSCGLPRDNISTENAILVKQAGRWPLMIDPQEQANRWIRQLETENQLKVIKLTDSNFMRTVETAVTIGIPVLLEEVEEALDPTLEPILLKQTFSQGGRLLIRLGESDVEYNEHFRFYITTKLANPHYLPEICIKVTIVNFTVTLSGLEDQLLADVVRLERPDLERQRTELIIKINADKSQLKAIEDKILYLLYHSEGNILDDEELIETLNESKETSAIIEARLIETESTEEKISVAREKYRLVAVRGSVLYFVVANLADIDPMYQYSLKYFNQVFNTVIEVSEKKEVLEQRLAILIKEITKAIYTNISRGLFERHKLVFSFMLCVAVLQQSGIVTDAQWNFLLRGPVATKTAIPKKPDNPVITDAMWSAAYFLSSTYEHFEGLDVDFLKRIHLEIGDFKLDIRLVDPKKGPADSRRDWNTQLDDFDKLMLIKTVAEEKLIFAIAEYVKIKLGKTFIESPQISLSVLYEDTTNGVPLIFVLSTGSDPFEAFQRFANEMNFGDRVKSISLGQGQGPVAEKMIQEAVEKGDWVFLQNCHLATSWMLAMETIVLAIARDTEKVHKEFRLFLSSMPSKAFPVSVLQNSVKVTNEPPKGLRANVKRAFTDMDKNFFEHHHLEHQWKAMIFGLCMFHAVIQERKKFGPLGWNIVYEFNDSDRDFAFNSLKMFCVEESIPWDALEYLTGEITYGGRVTDYWDLRCLKTILKIFFSPKILTSGYVYSESGIYYCPVFLTIQEYREFVDNLPIIEQPEIFGMHENANIAYQVKETNIIVRTIMECQPRTGGGVEGRSSDDIVYDLAEGILTYIIKKIPTEHVNAYMFKKDKKGRVPSLTTVLTQEIDRYDKLLKMIHESMEQLQKAIKGLVVMSDALEEIFTAFINNTVPGMWNRIAYNSLKSLGSWTRDLILRLDFISTWVRYGAPTSYWISGFYFPQGFLTGSLQTHARKYNLPIDELKFDFYIYKQMLDQEDIYNKHIVVGKEVYESYKLYEVPTDGVIVHGLFIDAGRWDLTIDELVDARPGEINPPLPIMWLQPTRTLPPNDTRYAAPLYKTSVRAGVLSTTGHSTNFVIAVFLPTRYPQEYWILKGTALLTQITD